MGFKPLFSRYLPPSTQSFCLPFLLRNFSPQLPLSQNSLSTSFLPNTVPLYKNRKVSMNKNVRFIYTNFKFLLIWPNFFKVILYRYTSSSYRGMPYWNLYILFRYPLLIQSCRKSMSTSMTTHSFHSKESNIALNTIDCFCPVKRSSYSLINIGDIGFQFFASFYSFPQIIFNAIC